MCAGIVLGVGVRGEPDKYILDFMRLGFLCVCWGDGGSEMNE